MTAPDASIPVIDLFAGPGGLGEGFEAYEPPNQQGRRFRIALSIEKDKHAHATLLLRTFYRQFPTGQAPETYYEYLRGDVTRQVLFNSYPEEAAAAHSIAWQATLGKIRGDKRRQRIKEAIAGNKIWVLIGGPPCQAYSLIGRSRMGEANAKDRRHTLYRHYLRIIAEHQPPVFVMENVRGLLSAKRNGRDVFTRMRADLTNPAKALRLGSGPGYVLHGLDAQHADLFGEHREFLLRAELFGVPQARHRIIIVGVRADIDIRPELLNRETSPTAVFDVLYDLPPLRSSISRMPDCEEDWRKQVQQGAAAKYLRLVRDEKCRVALRRAADNLVAEAMTGGRYVPNRTGKPVRLANWLVDPKLGGACNHEARGHMREDLWRYLFASCFAQVHGRSPNLDDFPDHLLPEHKNAVRSGDRPFNDRFRVQAAGRPATTVTAHISKDGHYYIHYDPTQCRSWTVREAARVQTFPDNYFFEGPRTSQFQQVGNAVPPLLAHKIAAPVFKLLQEWKHGQAQPRTPKLEHEPHSKQRNSPGTSSPPDFAEARTALPIAAKAAGHS